MCPSTAAPHAQPEHTLTIKDKPRQIIQKENILFTIKDKPSDLGIKSIKDKDSWINTRKLH